MKKKVAVVVSILIILGIMVVGLISIIDGEQLISGDSLKFKEEYELLNGKYFEDKNIIASTIELEKDNPFIYVNDYDILEKLTEGTHIIYFGNPECGWSRRVVPILTKFASNNKISRIYYYNFSNLEKQMVNGYNNDKQELYDNILNIIGEYGVSENNKLLTPIVFFIKDGNILGSHYKVVDSYVDYNEELSELQKQELLNIYQENYQKMFANVCDEDANV